MSVTSSLFKQSATFSLAIALYWGSQTSTASGVVDGDECKSPGFLNEGQCWVILKQQEDCSVDPVIVELEDQPVYCPRSEIISKRANEYRKKLEKLKAKTVNDEIQGVIAMGSYYLLGYSKGKNNSDYVIPGITKEQDKKNVCKIVVLADIDSSVSDRYYLEYKRALLEYSAQFNRELVGYCQTK